MCVTNHHEMALAVKVALNPNTTNQPNQTCTGCAFPKRQIFNISKLKGFAYHNFQFDEDNIKFGKGVVRHQKILLYN